MKKIWLVCFVIILALVASPAFAAKKKKGGNKYEWGVGYQANFPAWGISVQKPFDDKITLQGIVGPGSLISTFAARGLYSLKGEKFWSIYGYGMAGLITYTGTDIDFFSPTFGQTTKEGSLGFGGGAGIEYNVQALSKDLPPIYFNAEIGLMAVKFEAFTSPFSGMVFGGGAHYRF